MPKKLPVCSKCGRAIRDKEFMQDGLRAQHLNACPPARATKQSTQENLLQLVREAQTEFWGLLRDLEEELGIEIDGTNDLCDYNIRELIAADRDNYKIQA